jgi:hypothetical protein
MQTSQSVGSYRSRVTHHGGYAQFPKLKTWDRTRCCQWCVVRRRTWHIRDQSIGGECANRVVLPQQEELPFSDGCRGYVMGDPMQTPQGGIDCR